MTSPSPPAETRVPTFAAWLGAAGVVPFAAGALALWFGPAAHADVAGYILIGYGAVILAFLGAVYWGLAAAPGAGDSRPLWYVLGVIPALAGWCALMLTTRAGLALLIVSFAAVFVADRAAVAAALAPSWYMRLRSPLSVAVIALLALALAAVWSLPT